MLIHYADLQILTLVCAHPEPKAGNQLCRRGWMGWPKWTRSYSIRENIPFAPITRTLLRSVNSILPILSDLFLMKLNNTFICYVISFPSRSHETSVQKAEQTSFANVSGLSVMCASLDITQWNTSLLLGVPFLLLGLRAVRLSLLSCCLLVLCLIFPFPC